MEITGSGLRKSETIENLLKKSRIIIRGNFYTKTKTGLCEHPWKSLESPWKSQEKTSQSTFQKQNTRLCEHHWKSLEVRSKSQEYESEATFQKKKK